MSDDVLPGPDPYDPDEDPDTGSTMTAPEGGRPDGAPAPSGHEAVVPDEDEAPPDE
ncbi:hypothetical protein [Terrabacter sp. NPDC000476]|uniref:hypothetical protein n=1 Tax=Terrabacter sp. NPDC000476 TaxID=3154258 RepID=UPI003326549B